MKLDGTGPRSPRPSIPAGWANAPSATVTFTCSDAASGLDADGCPAPGRVTAEGTTEVTGPSTDLAGNGLGDRDGPARPDQPDDLGSVAPAPNAAGWHKANATVPSPAATPRARPGSRRPPARAPTSRVTTDGVHPVTGHGDDRAGNTASTSVTVKLDKTNPGVVRRRRAGHREDVRHAPTRCPAWSRRRPAPTSPCA